MSTDPETTRIVRSWLDEGVTQLPDRVLDAALDLVPATRQRRANWRTLRFPIMNSTSVRYGLTAVAILIITIVGMGFFAPSENLGGPPTPSPMPLPAEGALEPGTYTIGPALPVPVTFEVGPGWLSGRFSVSEVEVLRMTGSTEIGFQVVENVVADPCGAGLLDPPVGPSVDEMVAAISSLDGFEASAPTDVTVDGFSGQEFQLTAPAETRCALRTWWNGTRVNGVGAAEVNLLRIIDVDGARLLISIAYHPSSLAGEDQFAEARRVVESVQIGP